MVNKDFIKKVILEFYDMKNNKLEESCFLELCLYLESIFDIKIEDHEIDKLNMSSPKALELFLNNKLRLIK